jgi:hypothetical protein
LFAKLPHPVESLLRDSPVINGLEIEPLLLLLRKILEMSDHFRFSDWDLFYVFHPRCSEPLRARVNFAVSQGFTVDQFHADVLQHIVPRRLFDSLKQELFGRLQRADESFAAYVTSLRDAALVFKLPLTDREVIDNTVHGLSRQQRSRLVFEARLTTWADIDRLCIHDRNMSFAEGIRLSDSSERSILVSERRSSNAVGRAVP